MTQQRLFDDPNEFAGWTDEQALAEAREYVEDFRRWVRFALNGGTQAGESHFQNCNH